MSITSIFDGHNDTILSLRGTGRSFFEESAEGHVDLPRAKRGGMVGGFFAVFVRDPKVDAIDTADPTASPYGDPNNMPDQMSQSYAERYALESLSQLAALERESGGEVGIEANPEVEIRLEV